MIRIFHQALLGLAMLAVIMMQPAAAQTPSPKIGIVVMHGKGGGPKWLVAGMAAALESKGMLVANLEMPWSGKRDYDASVADAEKEVEAALADLRAKGATHVFVAGHSQGGVFALYFGGKHTPDGIIAIAPGGNVANPIFREKLGEYVEQARKLVAEGKGSEKTQFFDFENAKGTYPVLSTPAVYLGWFDPDGAMNQTLAVKNMNPKLPVLYIVPTGDYPGLLRAKQPMFDALPRHALTRLYEPSASHTGAPSSSVDEILRWTAEVAVRKN